MGNHTDPDFAFACSVLRQIISDFWGCFYAGDAACTVPSLCYDYCAATGLNLINGNFTNSAKVISHGQLGTCTYPSCVAYCSGPTSYPTASPEAPSASPASPNSTCETAAVTEECTAKLPPPANSSDFDTACNNAKTYVANIEFCAFASTQYGNCTQAACLGSCGATGLAEGNMEIASLATLLAGGANGTCTYATCQDACTSAAPSSASRAAATAAALLGVVFAVVGLTAV